MARRIWKVRDGKPVRWRQKGKFHHKGAYKKGDSGGFVCPCCGWYWWRRGKRIICYHFHEPRWFNEEFFIRPERARNKQWLRAGDYEKAELNSRRTWQHRGRWDWT